MTKPPTKSRKPRCQRDKRPTTAEGVGFEPTEPVKAHSISNAANSTTLAPFRAGINYTKKAGDRLNRSFQLSPRSG